MYFAGFVPGSPAGSPIIPRVDAERIARRALLSINVSLTGARATTVPYKGTPTPQDRIVALPALNVAIVGDTPPLPAYHALPAGPVEVWLVEFAPASVLVIGGPIPRFHVAAYAVVNAVTGVTYSVFAGSQVV